MEMAPEARPALVDRVAKTAEEPPLLLLGASPGGPPKAIRAYVRYS